MVVLTTSETATSGVLAVLAYTTVTGRDVAAVLASLGEPSRHFLQDTTREMSEIKNSPEVLKRHPEPVQAIHRP